MIIVKLQGGLGNQMFQYAAAKATNRKPLLIDTDFFVKNNTTSNDFTKRNFELSIFENIKFKTVNPIYKYLLTHKLLNKSTYIYQSELNEFIDFKSIATSYLYLDGYFQNEDYFNEIRDELLYDFKFPKLSLTNAPLKELISEDETAVAIHVRRGDYLKPLVNAFHGITPIEYYVNAIEKIQSTHGKCNFYIFSDDIEWCKSNLGIGQATFITNDKAKSWEDMYLMSLCKHNIIANSSYSWWAAWLNINPNKLVIAPKKWFSLINSDIVPKEWIKI